MFNTNFGSKLAARSKKLFGKLDSIARQTGLIVRQSKKFSAAGFVTVLLQAVVSGKGSFTQMAVGLSAIEARSLTPQARELKSEEPDRCPWGDKLADLEIKKPRRGRKKWRDEED